MTKIPNEASVIIVPMRCSETLRLLKQAQEDPKLALKVLEVENDKDLTRVVSEYSSSWIIGDLSPRWNSDGSIFEGSDLKSFIWPPTFVVAKSQPSERGASLLLQRGVLWCFNEVDINRKACPEFNSLLSNPTWKTSYGCVFQKITGTSIRNGNHLAIVVSEDGTHGRIVFSDGFIVAATYDNTYGIDALYELALLQSCRIDLHTLFFNSTPPHMKEPYLTVISKLLELANSRKQHLSVGRPPGLTRSFSSAVLTDFRQEFLANEGGEVEDTLSLAAQSDQIEKESSVQANQTNVSANTTVNEVNTMDLSEFVSNVPGSQGGVLLAFDGACLNAEGDVDSDTIAAVATMSLEHIGRLNELLGLNGIRSCAISGTNSTLLMRFDEEIYASFGSLVKNAPVVCKKI
jgi:predicted regulator of Ras-like GTPase activity (Roadblock/LC7/MglB family)